MYQVKFYKIVGSNQSIKSGYSDEYGVLNHMKEFNLKDGRKVN